MQILNGYIFNNYNKTLTIFKTKKMHYNIFNSTINVSWIFFVYLSSHGNRISVISAEY